MVWEMWMSQLQDFFINVVLEQAFEIVSALLL